MAGMDERENNFKDIGRAGQRTYRSEIIAALLIIVLVVGVALGVNKFFYGFDFPDLSFSGIAVQENSKDTGGGSGFQQSKDWRLVLVNSRYPITEEFHGELTELRYGQKVDSRIYPDLQAMFDEMREDGLSPRVVEGYRTSEEQEKRLNSKISEYMGYGKNRKDARELALQWEAKPGASEHQLGICIDISSESGDNAAANAVWEWMDLNCSRFGFIKRYPSNKTSITGVKGEAWHYRYVGKEAAGKIMDKGITLEEYLGAVPAKQ